MRIDIPAWFIWALVGLAVYNAVLCAAVIYCNIYLAIHPLKTGSKRIDLYLDFVMIQAALALFSFRVPYQLLENEAYIGNLASMLKNTKKRQVLMVLIHLPFVLIYYYSSIDHPMPLFCRIIYKTFCMSVWAVSIISLPFIPGMKSDGIFED